MQRQLHAIVRGHVQMVGFRYFVLDRARQLGLTGWVRNGDDGATVEVVAQGPEELLRELEAALYEGPRNARVEAVDSEWSDASEAHDSFDLRD